MLNALATVSDRAGSYVDVRIGLIDETLTCEEDALMDPHWMDPVSKAAIPVALILFFAQSTAMFLLASRRMTLGRWRAYAFVFRLAAIAMAGAGLLLPSVGDGPQTKLAAEHLLLGGLLNAVISVFQGVRVHLAVRRAVARQDAEDGTPPAP